MKSSIFISSLWRKTSFCKKYSNFKAFLCTQSVQTKKSEDYFFNPEVQKILERITGCDYEKIFRRRQTSMKPYKYEFVTDKKLKELQDTTALKAKSKLQMPPVMDVWKPIEGILSKDPELQGYLRNRVMFIDTSTSVSSRDRMITVRETDGTLRKASSEERHRMNQIFFPIPGRELETPPLFESPNLDNLLEKESYEFVLDCACVQFEPDDPSYHKVTHTTYEHIKHKKAFEALRSTRHFGPMAFYFAQRKDIDLLLTDMIERNLINDALDTIELLCLLNPESVKICRNVGESEIEVIKEYIRSTSLDKGLLEKVLQTYLEQQSIQKKEASA